MATSLHQLATRWAVPTIGAVMFLALVIAGLTFTSDTSSRAAAATGGPEMVLNIKGGSCDDALRPTVCDVSLGAQFTLSIDALGIPADGYIAVSTFVHVGSHLTYLPTSTAQEEFVWPDCLDGLAARAQIPFAALPGGEVVIHSCLTDPGVTSTFVGNLVELAFRCGQTDSSGIVRLIPKGELGEFQGTFYKDGANRAVMPKTADLLLNCGAGGPLTTPTPAPTNTPTATPVAPPTPTFPPPKANDNFSDAIEIMGTPFSNKGDTSSMTLEAGEPTSCHGMTNTIWYSFTPPTDLLLVANMAGSSFISPMMAVFTGSTLATLTEVGCASRQVFIAEAGVTYYFQLGACTNSVRVRCEADGGSLQFSLESGPVPEMVLNAPSGDCDDLVRPTTCDLPVGQKFSLNVDILFAPFLGYIHAQSYVEFGEYVPGNIEDPDAVDDPETTFIEGPGPCDDGLDNGRDGEPFTGHDEFDLDCIEAGIVYESSAANIDEFPWPDCRLAIRGTFGATIHLGCITGATAPLAVSSYEGPFIALSMTCSEETSSTDVRMLPSHDPVAGTGGALFTSPEVDQIVPNVSGLTINCVTEVGPAAVGGVVVGGDLRPLEQSGADEIATGRLTVFLALLLVGAPLAVGTIGWFASKRSRL